MDLSSVMARFGWTAKHANASLGLGQKLLYGAGGALAAGIPAYAIARMQGAKDSERARNLGFGAGVATGVAAPRIIQGLYDMARSSGLVPPQAQYQGGGT